MRKINELIWHCTATPEGREVTREEIDQWHKARGWKGIGYHKIVHLDGRVSEGRPESQVGAHVAGRNTGTIGYVYVGGLDANDKSKAKDTRTPAQKATMLKLTILAIEKYRLTMVSGHRDYANKACPCFDARAEYMPLVSLPADGMPERDEAKGGGGLSASRTIGGGGIAAAGGAAAAAQSGQEMLEAAEKAENAFTLGNILGLIIGLVILGGAMVAIYARWDDAGRPLPWRRK